MCRYERLCRFAFSRLACASTHLEGFTAKRTRTFASKRGIVEDEEIGRIGNEALRRCQKYVGCGLGSLTPGLPAVTTVSTKWNQPACLLIFSVMYAPVELTHTPIGTFRTAGREPCYQCLGASVGRSIISANSSERSVSNSSGAGYGHGF
jgi:hypothetical protein